VAVEPVRRLLEGACGTVFPGCAASLRQDLSHGGERSWDLAAGSLGYDSFAGRPVSPAALYDVASLTKSLVIAPLFVLLIARGLVRLDDPLTRFTHGFDPRVTLRQLLSHRSGLPAWRPYYRPLLRDGRPTVAPQEARAAFLAAMRA